jgi:hypothetical protein
MQWNEQTSRNAHARAFDMGGANAALAQTLRDEVVRFWKSRQPPKGWGTK